MPAILLADEARDEKLSGECRAEWVWTPDSTIQPEASLLSRLSEAADSQRNARKSWFVAEVGYVPRKGHKIIGPFYSKEEACAKERARLESGRFMIFGPFLTYAHTGDKVNQVDKVVLHLKDYREIHLDGARYDAVCWTLPAFDKFVMPYYAQIGSLEESDEVRKTFLRDTSFAAIHIPTSEIIEKKDSPELPSHALIPVSEDGERIALGMGLIVEWRGRMVVIPG